jgi:GTP-binding protein Era
MDNQKSAFVAIVGRPNVGKSSLLNKILGQKVAIVSNKPQTTRTRIMGVKTLDETQIVYIDTPGFHKPKNKLGERMMDSVSQGLSDVDVVMLVVEALPKFKLNPEDMPKAELALIEEIKNRRLKAILCINKIDLLTDKSDLLEVISAYQNLYDFDAIIPVSAESGDGVETLVDEQLKYAKESPHFFADDEVTDQADSVMVTEMIREKMLHLLDKEIPHGIAVGLERFFERDTVQGEPIIEAEATIYCERDSHKGIIIGKGGAMLKKIGTLARADIEEFFGCKCNLKLWVKVKEDWRNRDGLIRSFGLDNK